MGSWLRYRPATPQRDGERGAVLVLLSVAIVVMIGAAALAVDVGQVTSNNRTLQASADVIAMDAGRTLSGKTAAQLSGAAGDTVLAVTHSAANNKVALSKLTVDLGTVSGSTFTSIATTILNGAVQTVASSSVPNAVRVTAQGTVNFAFSRGGKTTSRSAVVSQEAITGIALGSFLARVDTSTSSLFTQMLGGFIGANLTLVSYAGIANGTITLGDLQTALSASSIADLLDTTKPGTSLKTLLTKVADILDAKHDAAASDVRTIANNTSAALTVKLGDFITVTATDKSAASDAGIDLLQFIEMAAETSNNGASAINLTLSTSSLGGLGALLNAAGNSVQLKVIQPPQIAIGPARTDGSGNWVTAVHTAQVRLYVHLRPLGTVLGGLIDLPVYVEAASATASVRQITCGTPVDSSTVKVHTDAQAVRARVGTLSDINAVNPTLSDATILSVPLVASVTARADVSLAGSSSDLTFHGPFSWTNTQTVGSSSLGLGNLIESQPLNLSLNVLGLGLGLGGVLSSVLALVNPVLSAVDNGLLDPVLAALGLSLGGGDITNFSIDCNALRLVS